MIISTVLWQYRDDSGEVFVPLYKGDYDKGAEEQKLSSCEKVMPNIYPLAMCV